MAIDNLDDLFTELSSASESLDWDETEAMEIEVRCHIHNNAEERTVEHVILDIEMMDNIVWINLGGELFDAS